MDLRSIKFIFMVVFFHQDLSNSIITLSNEESRHCVKALRHKEGDTVEITDGKGRMAKGVIVAASPTDCAINIVEITETEPRRIRLHIAVAPTKNSDRIEWFVEKAVEIGIEKISFIICEHSERPKIDLERLHRIAVAALKQSQTTLIPEMELLKFSEFIEKQKNTTSHNYIAWCDNENTEQFVNETITEGEILLLIGPEGDFSTEEISICKSLHFKEIKLGNRRLRTETAALYGCITVAGLNER